VIDHSLTASPHSPISSRYIYTDMSAKKSGLQKEVLALYRRYATIERECKLLDESHSALRMVRTKPALTQPKFLLFLRYTFHTQASSVSPRNVTAIEHLLRRGKRQLEMYEQPSVKDCQISQTMRDWEKSQRGLRTIS